MFQNLCLSLLALVTYLRNEIMEDHGIYNSTIGLFWNLQDFELGRVRMVKLLLLVVHKCFICPNVSYVIICPNWAFLCICWWLVCLRFKLLSRDPRFRRSNQRYFASNLGTLPHLIIFVFCSFAFWTCVFSFIRILVLHDLIAAVWCACLLWHSN